jgi:hypothetical protein
VQALNIDQRSANHGCRSNGFISIAEQVSDYRVLLSFGTTREDMAKGSNKKTKKNEKKRKEKNETFRHRKGSGQTM